MSAPTPVPNQREHSALDWPRTQSIIRSVRCGERMSDAQGLARIAAVAVLCATLIGGARPACADPDFSVPPPLRPSVDFWVSIFATYGKRQVVIHDTERLDRVYSVLDLSELNREGVSEGQVDLAMKTEEDAEKARIRGILRRLDQVDPRTDVLTPEEQRIVALFADDRSPTKFSDAAADDRVRGQRGLRERFAEGVRVAHAYFPRMEQIFRQEGVPLEITRLPLVESCFNVHAYSKVGAAGVWQFMPGTARNFMHVNGIVDERLDPIVSTRAAARFMRQNYDRLGTWPLAIKAWNHGPGGIARAVRETGTTDVATIIQNYHGPAYKFASRNFYPEFLAALQVESGYRTYFGDMALDPPLAADTVELAQGTTITAVAHCAGTDPWEIAALNPSLLPPVHAGQRPIPAGYQLRLPHGTVDRFQSCAASLPPPRQVASMTAGARRAAVRAASARMVTTNRARQTHVVHKVKAGQTLAQIASLYGCSVEEIRRGNRIKGNKIHAGQVLRIPTS
jgi:membrane-bound lytic murein transglycosylase D